jgi:large subunit ribosomal protein L10
MTKEEKTNAIAELKEKLQNASVIYLADTSELTVENTNKLRRLCFNRKVQLSVVKNTLLKKAIEQSSDKNLTDLISVLHGPTSLMISEGGSIPAKLIKDFRKTSAKPILKGAYIEESVYVGDDQLEALASLKSKNELIGDVIALLQSPSKNVVSALQSGKSKLAGIVKTLSEKQE